MNSKDLSLNLLWYSITWSSNHLSPRTVLPLFLLRFGLFATSRFSAITLVRIWRRDSCEMNKAHKLWRNFENLLRQNTSHNCYHSISVITRRTRYLVRQLDVRLLSRNNGVTGNLTLIYLVVMATKKARSSAKAVVTRKINEIIALMTDEGNVEEVNKNLANYWKLLTNFKPYTKHFTKNL